MSFVERCIKLYYCCVPIWKIRGYPTYIATYCYTLSTVPAHQIFLGSGSQSPSSMQVMMTSVVLDRVTVGQMMVTFVPSSAGSVYPDTITSEHKFKRGSSHLTVVKLILC